MMHWLSKQTTSIYFYLKTIIANQQKKKKTKKLLMGHDLCFTIFLMGNIIFIKLSSSKQSYWHQHRPVLLLKYC
jgi:hypothetical protein